MGVVERTALLQFGLSRVRFGFENVEADCGKHGVICQALSVNFKIRGHVATPACQVVRPGRLIKLLMQHLDDGKRAVVFSLGKSEIRKHPTLVKQASISNIPRGWNLQWYDGSEPACMLRRNQTGSAALVTNVRAGLGIVTGAMSYHYMPFPY